MKLAALLLALAAPVPALAAEAATPALPPIQVDGWTFVGAAATTMMFIKPAPTPPGAAFQRVLVRFEESKPFARRDFASMSDVEIDEIDCAGHMTRVIQDTRYAERNMMGERHVDVVPMPMWSAETAGSFGAGILNAVCGESPKHDLEPPTVG